MRRLVAKVWDGSEWVGDENVIATASTFDQNDGVAATSLATQVTNPTVVNTKGAYTTLIASAASAADCLQLEINTTATSAWQDYLIDIALGGVGSETVLFPNILISTTNGDHPTTVLTAPLAIPQGARVSARFQAGSLSGLGGLHIGAHLITGSAMPPGTLVTAYGINTSDSGGLSLDPGGTINTKPGTYTEVTSSTTGQIKWLVIAFGGQGNSVRTDARWLVDVASGGSGSEVDILQNVPLRVATPTDHIMPGLLCFPVQIPVGTRLSARAQCNISDATDRLVDIAIYGIS